MATKPVTIKFIANELGIHHSTVSRALRNDPRVNKKTKKTIRACAKKYNYQPNIIAVNLRKAKSKTIGLIVPSIHHYYFSHIIGLITDLAYKEGYTIIITQSNESLELEIQNIKTLIQSRVCGVIASISRETQKSDHFKMLMQKNIPLVFFDRVCENLNTSKVMVRNKEGAINAVNHLVQSGYKRIAYLGGCITTNVFRERFQGYREGLLLNSCAFHDAWIVCNEYSFNAGISGMHQLLSLQNRPDAVLSVSFELTMGALYEAYNQRLNVPQDFAFVTFGESPINQIIRPGITTVAQPRKQIAELAFKLLLNLVEKGTDEANFSTKWLDTELIIRESSIR